VSPYRVCELHTVHPPCIDWTRGREPQQLHGRTDGPEGCRGLGSCSAGTHLPDSRLHGFQWRNRCIFVTEDQLVSSSLSSPLASDGCAEVLRRFCTRRVWLVEKPAPTFRRPRSLHPLFFFSRVEKFPASPPKHNTTLLLTFLQHHKEQHQLALCHSLLLLPPQSKASPWTSSSSCSSSRVCCCVSYTPAPPHCSCLTLPSRYRACQVCYLHTQQELLHISCILEWLAPDRVQPSQA
jgi:hypothetical protein